MTNGAVEFRLLGPLEAAAAGEALPLGGPKQRALLALLLIHANEVVSVDTLIEELWGESPPRTAPAYIQNCVSRLRKALGPELLETRPPGYVLKVDPQTIDARRFERLTQHLGGAKIYLKREELNHTGAHKVNNVLGQIIDSLIGTRYAVSDRQAIRQCTYAAVNQAETRYRPYYGPNWRRPYAGYNGYIRVSAITDVRRRSNGVRVRGLLDTGLYRRQTHGGAYDGGYVGGYGGDLNFRCDVDYRGYVSNVRVDHNSDYRG